MTECETCDYDNAVRHGRADYRCPKCGRQLIFELVLMQSMVDNENIPPL